MVALEVVQRRECPTETSVRQLEDSSTPRGSAVVSCMASGRCRPVDISRLIQVQPAIRYAAVRTASEVMQQGECLGLAGCTVTATSEQTRASAKTLLRTLRFETDVGSWSGFVLMASLIEYDG